MSSPRDLDQRWAGSAATLDDAYRWWSIPRREVEAPLQLLCFSHAGGAAAAYVPWAKLLPEFVQLVICQLPGRAARLAEQPIPAIDELAELVVDSIAPLPPAPRVLFGHSMGAVLAFEVGVRLQLDGHDVRGLCVAGSKPPHRMPSGLKLHRLRGVELIEAVSRTYGGVPPVVLEDAELRELLAPALQADLEAIETYTFDGGGPMTCPMAIYGGQSDVHAPPAEMREWARHTTGPATVTLFDGGHFFYREAAQSAVLRDLSQRLETWRT